MPLEMQSGKETSISSVDLSDNGRQLTLSTAPDTSCFFLSVALIIEGAGPSSVRRVPTLLCGFFRKGKQSTEPFTACCFRFHFLQPGPPATHLPPQEPNDQLYIRPEREGARFSPDQPFCFGGQERAR